jgi:hypothetical protein
LAEQLPSSAPKQNIDRNALAKIDHNFTSTEDWTPTFSPNLLFDFRSSVIVRAGFNNYSPLGFDQSTLGWRFPQTHLNVGYAPRDSTADRTPTPEAGYGSTLTAQIHARRIPIALLQQTELISGSPR